MHGVAVDNATNQLFTCGMDNTIRVWDLITFRQVRVVPCDRPIQCMFVDEERNWLICCTSEDARA